jgi:hypothetical protein
LRGLAATNPFIVIAKFSRGQRFTQWLSAGLGGSLSLTKAAEPPVHFTKKLMSLVPPVIGQRRCSGVHT